MTHIRARPVLFACGVTLLAARLASAQSTGSIAGTVTDTSGAALPGVTVEAASPALIEKVRTVTSDAAGAYKIEALRPGTYSVTFTLPGFAGSKREGIELTSGFTASINAELRVGSIEETITVTGATPVVDVQNTTARTVITAAVLDNVVMSKSTAGFAAVLLGARVIAGSQDVAGSTGEFPAQISVHGGREGDQVFTWDGLRMYTLSSSTGAGQNHAYYPNMLMVQEVTFDVGNAAANVEVGGIQQNFVPKDGGNRFTGSAIANYSGPTLQSSNLNDRLRARGVLTEPSKIRKIYDTGVSVGGPLRRDRVWFYASTHAWGSENTIAGTYYNGTQDTGVYTPDLSRPGYQSLLLEEPVNGRVTWQMTSKQKIGAQYGQQPQCLCGFSLGATISPESALNQRYSKNFSSQVSWTYVRTSRLLFRGGVSAMNTHTDVPPTEGVAPNALAYAEFPRNLAYNNALGKTAPGRGNINWTGQSVALSASYVTGSHAATVGFSWYGGSVVQYRPEIPPDVGLPAILGVTRATPTSVPVPFQIDERLAAFNSSRLKANVGIYAQDQWKLRRVTVNAGLRFDYLNAYTRARCRPADMYTPELCSPGVTDVPNWKDLNPRLGVVYDLFGTGKTAFKAALGRYVNTQGIQEAAASDPLAALSTSTLRSWTDENGDYRPGCVLANPAANGECGPILNPLFGTSIPVTRFADSYLHGFGARGYSWQGQVSIQQELRPGLGVSVGYFRTSFGNFTVTDNLNVTPADYDPYCITVPTDSRLPNSGTQSCGWYDLTPAALARGPNNLIRPASDFGTITEVYHGVDVQTNWRFGRGGLLQGGINVGHTENDQCFVVDSPQQLKDCNLVLGWSAQRQVKFLGSYPLPWGVTLSGTFQNLAGVANNASVTLTRAQALTQTSLGRPFSATSITTTRTVTGIVTQGAQPSPGNLFTPNTKLDDPLYQVDLRVMRDFRFSSGRRLRGIVDFGNVFNANPVLAVQQAYTPTTWLTPALVLPPRIVKFGVTVDF